jgi:predicted NBD/HSP70 family sugar kinase
MNIGVFASESIAAGLVQDHKLAGPLIEAPGLQGLPRDEVAHQLYLTMAEACQAAGVATDAVSAVGVGIPGIIRGSIIEESPNIPQLKGLNLEAALVAKLRSAGLNTTVLVLNDADATAAGVAATRGHLEKLIRVWTLGWGIGFGRYPRAEGVWEGGHGVVTLDPKEQFCGCGGQGHLEGIMGHRAMRMRFLDLEPEEVFANAKTGDVRCMAFVDMWHRALAAATATTVHQAGPGRFYISGMNSKYIEVGLLSQYLHDMVKMTPLQGSIFEVITTSVETAIIGAAVNASLQIAKG